MKNPRQTFGLRVLSLAVFGLVLSMSFGRVYMRLQTTLLGYELGELKARENVLIEQRGGLQVALSKLTTRNHLTLLSNERTGNTALGAYASK